MDELLDNAPCGFLSFADTGTIVTVNATLAEMLGYEPDELAGRSVETTLTVASRIFFQTHFFPLLKLHGHAEEIYLSLRTRAGEEMPVLANALRRERAGAFATDCVFVRLRQRQKWEDEILRAKRAAEEANLAKSKFLSTMSHELRTPLNAITGYTELLSLGIRGPVTDAQRADLTRIENAGRYLLSLINDVLNFARIEAGQVYLEIKAVPVDAALSEAESLISPRLRQAGLEYGREGCGADAAVRADPERLQQILLNLLTNAIKFTPRGGRITVTCEAVEVRILLHVRDTGRGIPADQIARIFDPFVQIDRQRNEESQQGVGLGLSISRDLARAMGGALTAESTVDEGSIFTLSLPAAGVASQEPEQ
jgi:PAS domain S-box-containing protein